MTSKDIKFEEGLRNLLGCAHWAGKRFFSVCFYRKYQNQSIRFNGFRACYSR